VLMNSKLQVGRNVTKEQSQRLCSTKSATARSRLHFKNTQRRALP